MKLTQCIYSNNKSFFFVEMKDKLILINKIFATGLPSGFKLEGDKDVM